MPSLGGWEFVILIGILVLLFGAKRLPDMARSIGQSARVFKGEMKGMKNDDPAKDQQPEPPPAPQALPQSPPLPPQQAPAPPQAPQTARQDAPASQPGSSSTGQ
jgi:sec-independent protein translocase protein TatA